MQQVEPYGQLHALIGTQVHPKHDRRLRLVFLLLVSSPPPLTCW